MLECGFYFFALRERGGGCFRIRFSFPFWTKFPTLSWVVLANFPCIFLVSRSHHSPSKGDFALVQDSGAFELVREKGFHVGARNGYFALVRGKRAFALVQWK